MVPPAEAPIVARPRSSAREAAVALGVALAWALVVRPGPLSLPYFWDEADVYAPGARWLAQHGFDATPGVFPDDWSRGHPPLFYLVAALAFLALGTAPAVAHALVVPFTAVALAGTYVLGTERGGRWVGALAAALLGASPLFMSAGAFLLPEMPLTALTVLALVALSRGRVGWAAVCGVALVWVKETGVFTALAIAGGALVAGVASRAPWEETWRRVRLSLLPVLALAVFFGWQRVMAGYFVFPHHADLFSERRLEWSNAWTVFPSIFLWHGRWLASAAALVALVALAVRRRRPPLDATTIAVVLLVLGNAVFFAKMFWLERYALPAHPGVCVLLAQLSASGTALLPARARRAFAVPLALATGIGLASLRLPATPGAPEQTFAFADVIGAHRGACARIAALGSDRRVLTTWPLTAELREPWLGYAPHSVHAVHVDRLEQEPHLAADLVLVDASSGKHAVLERYARSRGLTRRWTLRHGTAPELTLWGR